MTAGVHSPLNELVYATAVAIAEDPSLATVVLRAGATPEGAVGSAVALGAHTVRIDEPPTLGGDGSAPSPVEVYLASLIACQVVTYRFWAQRLGVVIDDLSIEAEGDLNVRGFFGLDDSTRPGFQEVRITVRIAGPESAARYAELQEAVDAHCPVLDLTTGKTPVNTTLIAG